MNNNFFEKYTLLLNFFNFYGHSNVPQKFITKDGINKENEGTDLGAFVNALKAKHQGKRPSFSTMEIELLKNVNINFERRKTKRMHQFQCLVNYYNQYGNCSVPRGFKTNNGIDFDDNGFDLGYFVVKIRRFARGLKGSLSDDEYTILCDIQFDFEPSGHKLLHNYSMLLNFLKHYGHMSIPENFITQDGIMASNEGENLSYIYLTLMQRYKNNPNNFNDIELMILKDLNLPLLANDFANQKTRK